MLWVAGVFAEFERELLKKCGPASLELAKAEGRTIGCPSQTTNALIISIKFFCGPDEGIKKITTKLNVGVGNVCKALKQEFLVDLTLDSL